MWRSGLRKILRDVFSRKTRTFLVSASIFIGVLGVVGLFTTSRVISQTLSKDIQEDEIAMIELRVNINEDAELDNAQYLETLNRQNDTGQEIEALDGITQVEAWAYYFVSMRTETRQDYETVEIRARFSPLEDSQIEPIQLREGAFPIAGQNEIAIERRMADRLELGVGDVLIFRTQSEAGLDEVTYTIVGIVFDPYSTTGIARSEPPPDIGVYAQYEDAQAIVGFVGVNRFLARYETFAQAEAGFAGFVRAISELTPYSPVQPQIENPTENRQVEAATIFTNVLNALAFTTMIVSGFLVVNVINTIVAEQKTQIGILKSIGVTVGESFLIYSGIALTYGIIGTVFAIIPGIVLSQLITGILAPELDILVEGFNWSWEAVLIGVVMGLAVPVVAAAFPVYNGARISIMEAITDLGISGSYGAGMIPRLINSLPFPIGVRQAISNVYQKRWRLFLTGTTLTVTIATFMATSAVNVSLINEIQSIFGRLGYQVIVQPNNLSDYAQADAIMNDLDTVEKTSPASLAFVQLEGGFTNFFTGDNQVQVFGIDPRGNALDFEYVDGIGWDEDINRPGLVVSQSVANQLNKGAGDVVDIVVAGQRHQVELIGIDAGGFDTANMRWQEVSQYAGFVSGAPVPNEYVEFVNVDGQSAVAIGADDVQLTFIASDYDPEAPGVIITAALSDALGLGFGDTLSVTVGEQTVERPILTVIDKETLVSADERLAAAPDNLILFGFSDLTRITGVDTDGEPIPNALYVTMQNPDPSIAEVDTFIRELEAALLAEGISARYTNQKDQEQIAIDGVSANTAIFLVVSVLIAAVGAIGLLTTLTISVFERQKEIGVMRSIGAGAGSIALQFILEGVIVGFVAWLVGLPFGYFGALALNRVAELDNVPFTYPVNIMVLGLIGMLLIAALASALPAMSAARKTVSEILRYQ